MKHPLHLMIHVPLREKRDFRQTLVGLKNALCISLNGTITTYDLLPPSKPRKGQEHRLIEQLAEQLAQGWTLAVWDVDRLLRELEEIVKGVRIARPKLTPLVDAAWSVISSADDEQIVDLRSFQKFPGGHYVAIVAEREDIDFDDYPPRRRRRLMAYRSKSRPVSEDFWGVFHPLIMTKQEAEQAWGAYQRWVKNNRPRPPQPDSDIGGTATQEARPVPGGSNA